MFEHELLRLMEEKNRLERAILASQDRMNRELDALKKVPCTASLNGRAILTSLSLQTLEHGTTRASSEPKLRELDVVRQVNHFFVVTSKSLHSATGATGLR